jgi:hypothetical protein
MIFQSIENHLLLSQMLIYRLSLKNDKKFNYFILYSLNLLYNLLKSVFV